MRLVDDTTYAYITDIDEGECDVAIIRYDRWLTETLEEEVYGPFDSPQTCAEHAQAMGIPANRIIGHDLKPVGGPA